MKTQGNMETATFALGCFWHPEKVFRETPGVVDVEVGYTGGTMENPTYENVCSDTTGHAEAVNVVFDPDRITYTKLLEVFWNSHDPTEVNRQGPDIGSQYRSAIFTHTDEQKVLAEKSKDALQESGKWQSAIATQVVDVGDFYRAEEYHQRYLEKKQGS